MMELLLTHLHKGARAQMMVETMIMDLSLCMRWHRPVLNTVHLVSQLIMMSLFRGCDVNEAQLFKLLEMVGTR